MYFNTGRHVTIMMWCPIFTPGGARICAVQPKKDLGETFELITEQGKVRVRPPRTGTEGRQNGAAPPWRRSAGGSSATGRK